MMPGTKLSAADVYYVEKFEPDNRGLEAVISEQLVGLGHTSSSGPAGQAPAEATVLVSYQDRWMWDITMYMIQLDIQMKDPANGRVVATGQSYRTSLARKSPAEMAREVLVQIFSKNEAPE